LLQRISYPKVCSLFLSILLIISFSAVAEPKLKFEPSPSPENLTSHNFVENTRCIECHTEQGKEWQDSHHAKAMQLADKHTVKADFNNVTFTHQDVTSTFFQSEDTYFINTIGPDKKLSDFKVKYTFGIEPLQQYIVELDKGRLQVLDIAWDTRPESQGGQNWFRLIPDREAQLGEPLHWTGSVYNWNNRCAECHSTNIQKNYNLALDTYDTSWSEINVSCQSCHGPGRDHIDWAALSDEDKQQHVNGLIVDYQKTKISQVDTCARCHSRRHQVSAEDGHGRNFLDDFMPSLLSEGLYHADGQILDEVFVYGSFLQSKMYAKGVGCLDCHNPHSGKLKLSGNALCLQCHQDSPPKQRFPSLQVKQYDSPEHHFHRQGSDGAQCVNCHMPATTYMEVDPRRDHSFNIPNPALSLKTNSPNACNSCHEDKSIEWAKKVMTEWYGDKPLTGQSYGELIYATRNGDVKALPRMVDLINNPDTPAIQAATLIQELVKYFPRPEALKSSIASLKHSDPLIRATATGNLDQIPLQYRLPLVTPQLDDPIRAVRIAAARVAAAIPAREFSDKEAALKATIEEYKALQNSLSDTAEAHLNLGVLYTDQQQFNLAEEEFKQAILLNPYFLPAYINLANLYNHLGKNEAAEIKLRKAVKIAPDNGEIYYSLGLLLAEQNRYSDAVIELAKAVKLLPERIRIAYNYALALQHLEQYAAAEAVFKQTRVKAPANSDIVYALVTLYSQQQKWPQALEYAKLLVELSPNEKEPARLLQQIQYQLEH
jgi:predicted CXXCH cytochrome family protein